MGIGFVMGLTSSLGSCVSLLVPFSILASLEIHLKGSVGIMDLLLADDGLYEKFIEVKQSVEENVEEPVFNLRLRGDCDIASLPRIKLNCVLASFRCANGHEYSGKRPSMLVISSL